MIQLIWEFIGASGVPPNEKTKTKFCEHYH